MTQALDNIRNKALPILKRAGVTRSALFGSYVRGEAQPDSDIDILIEPPQGAGLFTIVALKRSLEGALKKKVDLITYRSLHPALREKILKEQIAIL
ncbi:MAG: hypothetical protein A2700_00195 [Candidatus Blackburnbacteria bacterium RIFCSPHIGHO2_01_FULL_44_64]|uniref:Polymerase nucleotidyl transferase domain-containing protein n=1 Tax=Candidatus Blackburnbacteria bacterium RIFCSPHIGHO2_02_FULL_44_20 TaxID=1797516 RepID=A0A1G1V7V9_9BACT|nr:MAG: hypothetical protein A2700_00195 [Candidatus Blackburnbacteria bacterium RIFCSPHIGHO2_01_FULL_44_64]OGY11163.1 MAG: hypothetical protein A3E16_01345 [Candidatus Blackburnbacteria bacterium RIFCSPHIGHO2_12_FULL_44_25]OGY11558.1 MAG: hypothetical protein A3D26_03340 [Candidatus Blackburnbacteria bacterium RIFCSPHIGHO2_02_FULL_44_20]OGY14114.1 MAG: hypothetical protein A3A62_02005 [Candidatus Blackburnbacteria bacterium RIFCSPLOWO2_01_FULL_44_43]OGY15772.1 MAG: hypothetical protein A3H88_0